MWRCGVNTFRKKRSKTTGKSSCGIIGDSARSNTQMYLENIGPAKEQSDWLILVIGPLN